MELKWCFPSALASGDPTVGKTALAHIFRSDGAHFQNYTLVSVGPGLRGLERPLAEGVTL